MLKGWRVMWRRVFAGTQRPGVRVDVLEAFVGSRAQKIITGLYSELCSALCLEYQIILKHANPLRCPTLRLPLATLTTTI